MSAPEWKGAEVRGFLIEESDRHISIIEERLVRFVDLVLDGDVDRAFGAVPWTYYAGCGASVTPVLTPPGIGDEEFWITFEKRSEGVYVTGRGSSPLAAMQAVIRAWPALRDRVLVRSIERGLDPAGLAPFLPPVPSAEGGAQ